jgi:nicotinamide-nucleotide amidase
MPTMGFCVDEQLIKQAEKAVDGLRNAKLTIVTAESCTGGLVAAALSHVPGVGECLHGGFVVYTKALKSAALDVSQQVLEEDGSVNSTVASQLATGALRHSPASVAIAITGVLGPGPDEDGNPAGQIYFAVARRNEAPRVIMESMAGENPDVVRHSAVMRALELLRDVAIVTPSPG